MCDVQLEKKLALCIHYTGSVMTISDLENERHYFFYPYLNRIDLSSCIFFIYFFQIFVCLLILLLYVPSKQLWSWLDVRSPNHNFSYRLRYAARYIT